MFSVQNYNLVADTQTGLPLAEIFYQATSTKGGAFGLVFMVWVALGPCVIGSQLSERNYSFQIQTPLTGFEVLVAFFGLLPETRASRCRECKKDRPSNIEILLTISVGRVFIPDSALPSTHSFASA